MLQESLIDKCHDDTALTCFRTVSVLGEEKKDSGEPLLWLGKNSISCTLLLSWSAFQFPCTARGSVTVGRVNPELSFGNCESQTG
jgi:hypothetical protein